MKKSHIIGIVVIAIAIAIIMSTAGDASTYVNFDQAYEIAAAGNTNSIHVVGKLKTDNQGNITGIESGADNVSFSFLMVDENGNEQKVFYNEPMPPDLLRSEQVVIIGKYKGDLFVADNILLKCPSKYQEETLNAGI